MVHPKWWLTLFLANSKSPATVAAALPYHPLIRRKANLTIRKQVVGLPCGELLRDSNPAATVKTAKSKNRPFYLICFKLHFTLLLYFLLIKTVPLCPLLPKTIYHLQRDLCSTCRVYYHSYCNQGQSCLHPRCCCNTGTDRHLYNSQSSRHFQVFFPPLSKLYNVHHMYRHVYPLHDKPSLHYRIASRYAYYYPYTVHH